MGSERGLFRLGISGVLGFVVGISFVLQLFIFIIWFVSLRSLWVNFGIIMFLGLCHWLVLLFLSLLPDMGGQLHLVLELGLVGVFDSLLFNILLILRHLVGGLWLFNGLGRLLSVGFLTLLSSVLVVKGVSRIGRVSVLRLFRRWLVLLLLVSQWFLHLLVLIGLHFGLIGFSFSSSHLVWILFNVAVALLGILLVVHRLYLFVQVLSFLQQRTALVSIVLSGIKFFGLFVMGLVASGFAVVLLMEFP